MIGEEKKIEMLKRYINSQEQKMNDYYKIDEEFYKDEIEQLEFSIKLLRYILNLIEKQSKEIEKLINEVMEKELIIDGLKEDRRIAVEEIQEQYYVSKDKIKAKIEEYKKQIEKMEKDDIGRGFTLGKEWSDLKAKVEFGQSLLEKE